MLRWAMYQQAAWEGCFDMMTEYVVVWPTEELRVTQDVPSDPTPLMSGPCESQDAGSVPDQGLPHSLTSRPWSNHKKAFHLPSTRPCSRNLTKINSFLFMNSFPYLNFLWKYLRSSRVIYGSNHGPKFIHTWWAHTPTYPPIGPPPCEDMNLNFGIPLSFALLLEQNRPDVSCWAEASVRGTKRQPSIEYG